MSCRKPCGFLMQALREVGDRIRNEQRLWEKIVRGIRHRGAAGTPYALHAAIPASAGMTGIPFALHRQPKFHNGAGVNPAIPPRIARHLRNAVLSRRGSKSRDYPHRISRCRVSGSRRLYAGVRKFRVLRRGSKSRNPPRIARHLRNVNCSRPRE